ncbi:MAG: glycoside hydrolase family 16 protein [Clostridiales bacterium]|nr:glycoside hydrolase family 16 protein [Clostridiales bacterium]
MLDFLAPRQAKALKKMFTLFFTYKGTATKPILRFVAIVTAIVQLFFLVVSDTPVTPFGPALDLDKFELVWADEFDGDSVDRSNWSGHYTYGESASVRRGGYFQQDMAFVSDGNLIIRTDYREDGLGGGGPGYYSYGMDTGSHYEQLYGYFECRCILPKGVDLWAAFWMINDGTFNEDGSGEDGAEIDIFESPNWGKKKIQDSVTHTIHFDGYGDAHQSEHQGAFYVNNPYEEYNTYGLEWNKDEYIFYINGIESARTSFGVSQNPEIMILSVEVNGENAVPSEAIQNNTTYPADYVVDYVRAYQYK